MSGTGPIVSMRSLRVSFGSRVVLSGIDLDLVPGRTVALVGESGSGKSVLSRTMVGLTGRGARVTADRFEIDGRPVSGLPDREWRRLRGRRIGFVSQDALVALDPLRPAGREIAEALRLHSVGSRSARPGLVAEALRAAGVPDPARVARQRPGQLSGGLRQRALIASAVAASPEVLIADEPTTALDATVQARILTLLASFAARGDALVLVSHDLGVVASVADEILVMRSGQIVERGTAADVLGSALHPYTRSLLDAIPALHEPGERLSGEPATPLSRPRPTSQRPGIAIEASGLVKRYTMPGGEPRTVVSDVSLRVPVGKTLGLIGESGAGKTTVAGLMLGTVTPDAGTVLLHGEPWSELPERERRSRRSGIQMIYQDPLSSFDPRHTVRKILADALRISPRDRSRVLELLDLVGLGDRQLDQHPLRLSGGQRQRVAIARALATDPSVILCDEPVSAVDASTQAQVLDLLLDLQRELGLSYIFISHDLSVVRHVSHEVVVLRDGVAVEAGPASEVLVKPSHEYTRELLASVPAIPVIPAGPAAPTPPAPSAARHPNPHFSS
jgi:peptide/nickel transport system ATP-binding protein